ncbi:zinc ribbon domain-containing protein [Verrucomicrobiaceae bacterium N1E253]|uniref:Zinc ribbon domain-containing protein n=1 Tax=Oceaniferula marina TaxID=2748318 RepID=A0A851GL11_9BACT|nr:zinc ribbon domain-containing protein [Oceaniferula marina]NWK57819.1 zinc ribbon domain-containing protein [Oceaniferula marina]
MWNILQEMRINENQRRNDSIESDIRRSGGDLADLQRQVDKMALVNQALYELLRDRTGITDEDLRRKIRDIDKRDGAEDGKIKASPLRCPKCGGAVTVGALSCQTCGATVAPKYPFEK